MGFLLFNKNLFIKIQKNEYAIIDELYSIHTVCDQYI
jgi:hypothetical protein